MTELEKRASLAAYGDPGPLRDFEYDHLVPLALAGASQRFPQPLAGAGR